MTARERRLAGVLAVAIAVVVVASAVAAPLVAAGVAGAGPPANAATAPGPATAEHRLPAWTQQRTPVDPVPCSPTPGLVDVTTNATTAGTSVALADTGRPVGGAAAATVAGSPTIDDRPTTQPPRLTRRPAGPRTLCPAR